MKKYLVIVVLVIAGASIYYVANEGPLDVIKDSTLNTKYDANYWGNLLKTDSDTFQKAVDYCQQNDSFPNCAPVLAVEDLWKNYYGNFNQLNMFSNQYPTIDGKTYPCGTGYPYYMNLNDHYNINDAQWTPEKVIAFMDAQMSVKNGGDVCKKEFGDPKPRALTREDINHLVGGWKSLDSDS